MIARSHRLRTLGFALGATMIASVLHRDGASMSTWLLLVATGVVWPHVAWGLLRRSADPIALDRRFLLCDAVMVGAWVALMAFNVLPSVLLVTAFAISLVATGGGRLLVRGLAVQTVGCLVTVAIAGFAFAPVTDMLETLAALPLLVVFPVVLGVSTHRLIARVREQNLELRRIGSTDSLSGLLNRHSWERSVGALLQRGDVDSVVMMIDIDYFKHVNDRYGHPVGDDVVRHVGAVIRNNLRRGDLAGRYGGDEFVVLLCNADPDTAARVAERIRAGVAQSLAAGPAGLGLRCTLSIGLAKGPAGASGVSEWIQEADAALYRAKLAGRNRYVVAG